MPEREHRAEGEHFGDRDRNGSRREGSGADVEQVHAEHDRELQRRLVGRAHRGERDREAGGEHRGKVGQRHQDQEAEDGGHDAPLTCADVVDRGLVAPELWDRVTTAALAVFEHGRSLAAEVGLVLADTKYEFGLAADDGSLLLIDEMHTLDSSRYWVAATYEERLAAGEEP